MSNDNPFEGLNPDDFSPEEIAMDEMATIMSKLFKSLVAKDLSVQEAAALTAAFFAQNIPYPQRGPIDGS